MRKSSLAMASASLYRLPLTALLFVIVAVSPSLYAQLTPSQDAYTDSSKPTTNFGAATTLGTANTASTIQIAYVQFDLSSIPAGYTGTNVAKAMLKLYVNSVTGAGSFNVDYINGAWSEKTITHNSAPALGNTVVASVPLATANKNSYLLIDITTALQAWLNGTETNNGIALVANSPLNASFDSNESTTQSHPAEIDVVFSGPGTITGINTAAGSGLTGGGNAGTLNLSLLKNCAANQILQFVGGAWACSNAAVGTVTSVGLSAPASDFTVSGSPVQASGTLALNWNVAPTPNNTANAIVKRDNNGGFGAGAITASASGTYTGLTGTSPSGVGGYFVGGNGGVYAESDTDAYLNIAVYGVQKGAKQETFGVVGLAQSPNGAGVLGRGVGYSVMSYTYPPAFGTGVWGDTSASGGVGVYSTVDHGRAFVGLNNDPTDWTVQVTNYWPGGDTVTMNGYDQNGNFGECYVFFGGTLNCSTGISAPAKYFRIDHPLDPANKYLVHSSVESSEMMNIYTGNVTTNAEGEASVPLPDWFEAVNGDFRYQLTVIGQFAQAIVSREIQDRHFEIRTSVPNVKVSWQVTGIRHDAFAKMHPLVVEEEKEEQLRGFYIHPELYGAAQEKQIGMARHPELMKRPSAGREQALKPLMPGGSR